MELARHVLELDPAGASADDAEGERANPLIRRTNVALAQDGERSSTQLVIVEIDKGD